MSSLVAVRQLAGEYLGALRVQGYSLNTVRNYSLSLETYIKHLESNGYEFGTVDHGCLLRFLQALRMGGRGEATLQTYKSAVSSWYEWLIRIGKIDRNPIDMLAPIKVPEVDPRPLAVEDTEKILDSLDNLNWRNLERNRAILEIFYASGLRLNELRRLNLADLMMTAKDPHVVVRQGKGKKDGIGMLTPAAVAAIKAWLPKRAKILRKWERPNEQALFISRIGGRLGQWRIWDMIVDVGKKILGKRITTHQLRHSFCTDLLNNGADLESIRKLARHKKLTTTQKYLNVSTEHLREQYAKHPRMQKD